MSSPDPSVLKYQIGGLSVDAVLVLSKISLGWDDARIVKWGRGWGFTEEKVRRLFEEIGRELDAPHLVSSQAFRDYAGEQFRIHCEKNLPHFCTKRKGVAKKIKIKGPGFYNDRMNRRIEGLNPQDVSRVAEKLRGVDAISMEIARLVSNNVFDISVHLKIRASAATRLMRELYKKLELLNVGYMKRRAILIAAYGSL